MTRARPVPNARMLNVRNARKSEVKKNHSSYSVSSSTLHLVQLCQIHSKDFGIEVEIQRRMTRARVYPDTSQERFLYNLQQNRS